MLSTAGGGKQYWPIIWVPLAALVQRTLSRWQQDGVSWIVWLCFQSVVA